MLLRPTLPNVPGAGAENDPGLIQQVGLGLAHSEGPPFVFGLCPVVAAPVKATSLLMKIVTQGADMAR